MKHQNKNIEREIYIRFQSVLVNQKCTRERKSKNENN